MRRRLILAGSLCAGTLAVAAAWAFGLSSDGPPRSGEMARFVLVDDGGTPDIAFSDMGGTSLTLADYAGQLVLINFWATWCAPCIHEMPTLDRLQAEAGGEDFTGLAISVDRGGR